MTTHNVSGVGTSLLTLTANTVDTINFNLDHPAVELVNTGAFDVWYTVDGTTPAVDGGDSYLLPAGSAVTRAVFTAGPTVVKVISSGAAVLRVQRGY